LAGVFVTGANIGVSWRAREWPYGVAAGWKKRMLKNLARQFGQTPLRGDLRDRD